MNPYRIHYPFATIYLTQGQKTVIDLEDLEKCLKHRWYAHRDRNTFYVLTHFKNSVGVRTTLQLHNLVVPQFQEVDHIDRDGLNNCKNNFREGIDPTPES